MVDFQVPTVSDIPLLFTLLLLELILSFDNAAILAALANRLPGEQRRKALLYGLVGAYVFRVIAILFVFVILQNPWVLLVGAGYLLFLAVKHFIDLSRAHKEASAFTRAPPSLLGLSAFWSTIVYIELADVAFALDQIVVAAGLTDDVVVIIIAALVAIVFLRISAYYIGRVMEWFPPLEHLAYAAVGFVGIKIFLEFEYPFGPHPGEALVHVPNWVSITVTLSLIVLPPLVKFLKELLTGHLKEGWEDTELRHTPEVDRMESMHDEAAREARRELRDD